MEQFPVVTATRAPSGTALPAVSLIPEKVTVPVVGLDKERVAGPEAAAEAIPWSWTVPVPMLVELRTFPPFETGTTATLAVSV